MSIARSAGILFALFVCVSNAAPTNADSRATSVRMPTLSVVSTFKDGQTIPKQFTADGGDRSPALRWSTPPSNAKSIAIIVSDPDAPRGTWYHWLLYNLPANITYLNENVPKTPTTVGGAMQGTNDFNRIGYSGPAPPPGQKHRYEFRIAALDAMLSLKPGARKEEVLNAVREHEIAEGRLMGVYSR
ncbi:MAG TPA: YbhB/YbcL family Raf kinase inhibitor-like protein [Candidatus Obscuribacterales bacterium]